METNKDLKFEDAVTYSRLVLKKSFENFRYRGRDTWIRFILETGIVGFGTAYGKFIPIQSDFLRGLVGAIGWVILNLIWSLFRAPIILFFEERNKAERFTTKGIEVEPFLPGKDDVTPAGLLIRNKKDVQIICSCKMTDLWIDKSLYRKEIFPKPLLWYDNGRTQSGYYEIPSDKSAIALLEHIKTSEEESYFMLHAPARDGQESYGESIAIELSDFNFSLYEKKSYQAKIDFRFKVEGLSFTPRTIKIALSYKDGKLSTRILQDLQEKKSE